MMATNFEIVDRVREHSFGLTDVNDCRLREIGQIPAEKILENEYITLYSLDFENSRAVFVEVGPGAQKAVLAHAVAHGDVLGG